MCTQSAPRCTEVRCYRVVHAMHILVFKPGELMLSASVRTTLFARVYAGLRFVSAAVSAASHPVMGSWCWFSDAELVLNRACCLLQAL